MISSVTLVISIILGMVGGITNVVLWAESWADIKQFKSFKRIVTGAIVGFIYYFLVQNSGFPDLIMTYVAGYFGTDFLQGILEKFKPKP